MAKKSESSVEGRVRTLERRGFLKSATSIAMAGGLVLGYGTCGAIAVRFLYPSQDRMTRWQFVTQANKLQPGNALTYRTPAGETVTVARNGSGDAADSFIALSSTCPHLGCQVFWEGHRSRFFCPCHNGVFDSSGAAIEGPPAEAGQRLPEYPLKVENGLLFIDVPLEGLAELQTGSQTREHKA